MDFYWSHQINKGICIHVVALTQNDFGRWTFTIIYIELEWNDFVVSTSTLWEVARVRELGHYRLIHTLWYRYFIVLSHYNTHHTTITGFRASLEIAFDLIGYYCHSAQIIWWIYNLHMWARVNKHTDLIRAVAYMTASQYTQRPATRLHSFDGNMRSSRSRRLWRNRAEARLW